MIHFLKKEKQAIEKLSSFIKEGTPLATTTVNAFEILAGAYYLREPDQSKALTEIQKMLSFLKIFPMTLEASDRSALIYAELKRKGNIIEDKDIIIAGIAISNGIYKICTRNHGHFSKIPGIDVIKY